MNMIDQYGDPIPTDLVALSNQYVISLPDQASADSLMRELSAANWYEIQRNGLDPYAPPALAVSEAVIIRWEHAHGEYFEILDLSDVGIYGLLSTHVITYVAHILHRYSPEDGFYHA